MKKITIRITKYKEIGENYNADLEREKRMGKNLLDRENYSVIKGPRNIMDSK